MTDSMTRRRFVQTAALLAGAAGMPRLFASEPAKLQRGRHNVVFISVDDLNTDVGCYGHPIVRTPHLDALAANGVRFERAYCQYPWCLPSRSSFVSGLRHYRDAGGKGAAGGPPALDQVVILPELFKQAGYVTAKGGKIEHRDASRPRWGAKVGIWDELVADGPGYGGETFPGPSNQTDEQTFDGHQVRKAVEFMARHRDKPFFLGVGLSRPHAPHTAPKKYHDLYPIDRIELPRAPSDAEHSAIPEKYYNTKGSIANLSESEQRRAIGDYYACVTFMDAQLGLLLEGMQKLGLMQRTVIVFFSDHGYHMGDHGGVVGKGNTVLSERVARVPLVIAAPGCQRGAVSTGFAELVDLYPTLVDLCQLPPPDHLEGLSLAPLLTEPERPWKLAAFNYTEMGGVAVRAGKYRYARYDARTELLFDLEADPLEYRNLAGDSKHQSALAELRKLAQGGWKAALPKG